MVYEGRTVIETCPECGANDICPVDVCDMASGAMREGIECQKCGYRVVARTMAAAVSDWNGPCPHCGMEGEEPMETHDGVACCDDCACACSGCGAVALQDDAEELDGERSCPGCARELNEAAQYRRTHGRWPNDDEP